ncbi:MAG: helix-turn-helix domain-containing protein, partial [bacterium]
QPVDLPYNEAKAQSLLSFERSYFSNLLDRHHGNISRVANEAKVSRKTIYNILKKHSFDSYQNLLF